jgi:hypothetical protein
VAAKALLVDSLGIKFYQIILTSLYIYTVYSTYILTSILIRIPIEDSQNQREIPFSSQNQSDKQHQAQELMHVHGLVVIEIHSPRTIGHHRSPSRASSLR